MPTYPPFDLEDYVTKWPTITEETNDYLRRIAEALEKIVIWLYTPEKEDE